MSKLNYHLIPNKYNKPFSITAKSAGIELIRVLEAIPEEERIDALAIAVKVYTEDSDKIQELRKIAKELDD